MTHSRHGAVAAGTLRSPRYYEGPYDELDGGCLRTRLFTYRTDAGVVAGAIWNVWFTLNRPARAVWPVIKDWNPWMNPYGYYWPGVVGDLYSREERDLERRTFPITIKGSPGEAQEFTQYQLLRVIPEHLIVLYQPVVEGDCHGGVSPGFHVYMLNEREGKTIVTITMEHATRVSTDREEDALQHWRERENNTGAELSGKWSDVAGEIHRFWRDIFIPNITTLVYAKS
jgi:hypothetical protein